MAAQTKQSQVVVIVKAFCLGISAGTNGATESIGYSSGNPIDDEMCITPLAAVPEGQEPAHVVVCRMCNSRLGSRYVVE